MECPRSLSLSTDSLTAKCCFKQQPDMRNLRLGEGRLRHHPLIQPLAEGEDRIGHGGARLPRRGVREAVAAADDTRRVEIEAGEAKWLGELDPLRHRWQRVQRQRVQRQRGAAHAANRHA